MKSKITVNIDTGLLDLATQIFLDKDIDIDSLVQDALAKLLGVKQIWIKIDIDEQATIPAQIPIQKVLQPYNNTSKIKRQRQPKRILKIWGKIKSSLSSEFTIDDYWDTIRKNGFAYKNSARTSTMLEHLHLLEQANKITKIGEGPMRYRKLESEDVQETQKLGQVQETESTSTT